MNVLPKLDTGAMASVLPLREIECMDPQPNVVPTETVLKGFNNREVKKTHETRRVRVRPESLVKHS